MYNYIDAIIIYTIYNKTKTKNTKKVKTDTDDFPVKTVRIIDCGDVPIDEPFEVSDHLFE